MKLTLHTAIISAALINLGINANAASLLRGTPRTDLESKELHSLSSSRKMQNLEGHHYVKMVKQTEEGLGQEVEVEVDEHGDEVGPESEQNYNENEGFNGLSMIAEEYEEDLYAEEEILEDLLVSNETNLMIDQDGYYVDQNVEEFDEEEYEEEMIEDFISNETNLIDQDGYYYADQNVEEFYEEESYLYPPYSYEEGELVDLENEYEYEEFMPESELEEAFYEESYYPPYYAEGELVDPENEYDSMIEEFERFNNTEYIDEGIMDSLAGDEGGI